MAEKKQFHETVAENLIARLKEGTAPWQMPWDSSSLLPVNPTTGNRYKGINNIHLMAQGRNDPRWMTYKQATAAGGQVRKGEKSTTVQYWKFTEERDKLDDNGNPVLNASGKQEKETVKLERPRVFHASVFNGEQIDGLPELPEKEQTWSGIQRAETILAASGANILHGEKNGAFYRPGTDTIHLPDKEHFDAADKYYATALHELGHWTGHQTRLDRDLAHPFGSQGYAKEELRAEISSMILGVELGIGHDPDQHAAYVGSWIKVLEDEPLEIFRAAADAEKIQDYVISLEQKQIQEQENEIDQQEKEGRAVSNDNTDTQQNLVPDEDHEFFDRVREGNYQVFDKKTVEESGLPFYQAQSLDDFKIDGITPDDEFLAEVAPDLIFNPYPDHNDKFVKIYANPDGYTADSPDFFKNKTRGYDEAKPFFVSMPVLFNTLSSEELERAGQNAADELFPDFQHATWADVERDMEIEQSQKQVKEQSNDQSTRKISYINIPYAEKDEAKALGAKWDRKEQSWFIPNGVDADKFSKWQGDGASTAQQSKAEKQEVADKSDERVYLAVPYTERNEAKAEGAKWDKVAKSWFVKAEDDNPKLDRWRPDNVENQQAPAMHPKDEYADFLKSMGFDMSAGSEHPIMDGRGHRMKVEGDKGREQSGFYVGFLDGLPAGFAKNNRTGVEEKWKSKGYTISAEEKAKMQAEAAAKKEARIKETEAQHENASARVTKEASDLQQAAKQTPYLTQKGLNPTIGVLIDQEGKNTFLPAQDASGKQWSMQYIQEDGTKRFAKGSKKEGCFHTVGGHGSLDDAKAIVISEGYATAATISSVIDMPTVAAFDSGNLVPVAKALSEKYPDKPILIAGDDDRHLEMTQGVNPGKEKALAAADAVGGAAILPVFLAAETQWPKALDKVTPDAYRAHKAAESALADFKGNDQQRGELKKALLSGEQLDAMKRIKKFTDFNDLDQKSKLGRQGVFRQVYNAVSAVIIEPEVKKSQQRKEEERLQQKHQQQKNRKRSRVA